MKQLDLLNQMKRYLATFVSPYLDERIDGLWKICESVGNKLEHVARGSAALADHTSKYQAILTANGWGDRPSLRKVALALHWVGIPIDWTFLDQVRQLRNRLAHEYTTDASLDSISWGVHYRVLNELVERLTLSEFSAADLGQYGYEPQAIVNGKAL